MEPLERSILLKDPDDEIRDRDRKWSYLVQIQPGSHRPIFVLPGGVGGGGGEFFVYARLASHVGPEYPFYGLRARSAEGIARSHRTIEAMARDYLTEIRSLQAKDLTLFSENAAADSSLMKSLSSYAAKGKGLQR